MYASRIEKVLKKMELYDFSQILISDPISIYYLTGKMLEPDERLWAVSYTHLGKTILAGNAKMMTEQKIVWAEETAAQADNFLTQGCTVIYIAVGGKFAGFLVLSDTVRTESADIVSRLNHLHVQPVLLTGDHQNAEAAIAGQLHIREVHANCLPEAVSYTHLDVYKRQA